MNSSTNTPKTTMPVADDASKTDAGRATAGGSTDKMTTTHLPIDEKTAFGLYVKTMDERKAIDDTMTYLRTRLRSDAPPSPADLLFAVKQLEGYAKSIKDAVAEVCPQPPEPVQQVVLPVADPPCPRPEHCVQKHSWKPKELTEEEKAERKRKQEEREAKLKKDLEKVEEVVVSRSYRITARETIYKDEWLDNNGADVPEHKRDAFWAEYLDQWGVSITHNGEGEIDLEEREEDDDGNYEVDIDDDSPDANDIAKDFMEDDRVCVITGHSKTDMGEDDDLVATELGWMRESIAEHLPTIKELLLAKKA